MMSGPKDWWFSRLFVFLLFLPWLPTPAQAKTVGLSAIEVYPGNDGEDVVEISNFVLNQKNEVYECAGAASIDKSSYRKLSKVVLAPGMTLERNGQGVLMLSNAGQSAACVVPGNLRLAKDDALSPAALADRMSVEGTVLPGADPPIAQIPSVKAGSLIVFVPAPDLDLANYLRAQRQGDIAGWKRYLATNAGGAHTPDGQRALSALYVKAGAADLQAYIGSKAGRPDYGKLAEARQMADEARGQVPDDPGMADLSKRVHAEVVEVSQQSATRLELYRAALKNGTAGYSNLPAAESLADGAYLVGPSTPEARSAEQQSKLEQTKFDQALHASEQQISGGDPDEAALAIAPYEGFKSEEPRIALDIRAITTLWVSRAKKLQSNNDWQGAVRELKKAQAMLPSPGTASLLAAAQQQAHSAANQAAVQAAEQKSQEAQANNDPITAYEVLDDLPSEQKTLVGDKLQALQDAYLAAAKQKAADLRKASEPINGISDEQGIQKAYELTQRCYQLTDDPTLKDQRDLLAGELAAYYLSQGKKYADKPDGIGVNIAWSYLTEALHYSSAVNTGDVQDERARVRDTYNVKSKLSIRVAFRDATSRRDVVDFATQLTDAMAHGLESLGPQVLVFRAADTTPVPSNFQMVGDVIQHDLGKQEETVPKESTYRSSERPVRNPDYDKANRDYEQAKDDLQMARAMLQNALAKNKKKEIEAAKKTVSDDEQILKTANDKLSRLQEFNMVPVIDKYVYVERITHVKPTVVIQLRILDTSGSEVVPEVSVKREHEDQFTNLQNVQPTDTQGIHPAAGFAPDDADFYRKSEYDARDALIEQAKQKVGALPAILFDRAKRRSAEGDNEGAAELYIIYLNSTPGSDTPERNQAKQFLLKQFNFGELAFPAPAA